MLPLNCIEQLFDSIQQTNGYSRTMVNFATVVGFSIITITNLILAYKIIQGLWLNVFKQLCCPVNLRERYGEWAVVSGSTDGIGLAMARELARRGLSIIVIAWNEKELAATKASLEQEPNVGKIITINIDLSDSSLENFEAIRGQIGADHRDIGILINNAGTFPKEYMRFNRFDMDFSRRLVNLNILATVYLTKMIMPAMIGRGKGLLVNVSSMVASIPVPYMNLYGPTKSFISSFTRQLQIEYSDHPIDIVNLTPGGVYTGLFAESSGLKQPNLIHPTPEEYARKALNVVSTGVSSTTGNITHGVLKVFVQLVPSALIFFMKGRAEQFQMSPAPRRRKDNIC